MKNLTDLNMKLFSDCSWKIHGFLCMKPDKNTFCALKSFKTQSRMAIHDTLMRITVVINSTFCRGFRK